jgi:hypothetical protein
MGQFLDKSGTNLKQIWDKSRTNLGQFWDNSGKSSPLKSSSLKNSFLLQVTVVRGSRIGRPHMLHVVFVVPASKVYKTRRATPSACIEGAQDPLGCTFGDGLVVFIMVAS